jgi:hypothetical protein
MIIGGSIICREIDLHSRTRTVKLHSRKLGRDIWIRADWCGIQRVGRVVEPIVGNTMAVSKYQVPGYARIAGKVRDPVDDGLGDWELSEMATLDNETCNQTQKVVCALYIASGAKTNCRDTARFHTVTALLVIFVNLTIGAEHRTAMMCVVKATTESEFTGAITGTTGGRRKVIEPHYNEV